MLTNLHVKNIALIDDVDVEFSRGLNILTGETGAGKSILLGALNLALGKKMSSEMIGGFGDQALVELIFLVDSKKLRDELMSQDIICEDDQLILSRKVMDGRSICKINSETCTTTQLREVASLLLDVHGQHEHQKLLASEQQLSVLDDFAGDKVKRLKQEVAREYEQFKRLKEELDSFQGDEEIRVREIAFLEFEIKEIEEAQLHLGEDIALEKDFRKLNNSKKIAEGLTKAYDLTSGEGYNNASGLIGNALREVNDVKAYDEGLKDIYQTLLDVESTLGDYNREVANYLQGLTFSEEEFREMENRLNIINGLKNKYGHSVEAILEYQENQKMKLANLQNFTQARAIAEAKCQEQEAILRTLCDELTATRAECAKNFEQQLTQTLEDLNFNAVDFKVDFKKTDKFTMNGQDHVDFLISTNPGEARKQLNKVVSGGELSRIMLGIKALIADKEDAPTQIFDEIDAGISGRTAQMVAEKMGVIAKRRQVICITHLPQIAAMADSHYEITKNIQNNRTTTYINKLDERQMVEELARLLGGATITDSVLMNAQEMKQLANNYKVK